MKANSLPQKELDNSSMSSTPIEKEPVMECPLLLTTLSGVTFKVSSMGPGPSAKGGFAEDEGGVPFGEAPP